MILDTAFVIDLLERHPRAVKKAAELERGAEPLYATPITLFELGQGFPGRSAAYRKRVKSLIASLYHLPLDEEAAWLAGETLGELRRAGREIDGNDAMITSIALRHGQVVLTRNVEHFGRVRGLRVEAY